MGRIDRIDNAPPITRDEFAKEHPNLPGFIARMGPDVAARAAKILRAPSDPQNDTNPGKTS